MANSSPFRLVSAVAMIAACLGATAAQAQVATSPWIDHETAKSRLVAAAGDKGALVAFVEIEMPPGWKTYWRNPGDAGGLPPSFDASKSENAGHAQVLFPAPERLADANGETIGYKERALFPITFEVAAPDKPVILKVAAEFGVCREICVPLQASYELLVAPGAVGPAEGMLRAALDRVPRPTSQAKASDPKLTGARVDSSDEPAQISFTVTYPGGTEGADLFIEAPEGLYVPMPKPSAESQGDTVVFQSRIASAAELKQLLGQPLKATMVGPGGQSEAIVTVK